MFDDIEKNAAFFYFFQPEPLAKSFFYSAETKSHIK